MPSEFPGNYEIAKSQIGKLADHKLAKDAKWLDERTLKSTEEARVLAEDIKIEYESIVGKSMTARQGLFNEVLSPIAKREDFHISHSVIKGDVYNKYRGQGILFVLEQECEALSKAFREIPALRNLAYATLFNQMDKAGLDANYLPEGTQITMTNGQISIIYSNGREVGPFDLFPWPKAESVAKKESDAKSKKTVEAKTETVPESIKKLFPERVWSILKQDVKGVWYPDFTSGVKVETGIGTLSYSFKWQTNQRTDESEFRFYYYGVPSPEYAKEWFKRYTQYDMQYTVADTNAACSMALEIAKQDIIDSVTAGRNHYKEKWAHDYKAELDYIDYAYPKNIEGLKLLINAIEKTRENPNPEESTPAVTSNNELGTVDKALSGPNKLIKECDIKGAIEELRKLITENSGVDFTADPFKKDIAKRSRELLGDLMKNYGLVEKMELKGLTNFELVSFDNPDPKGEYEKAYDQFLNKNILTKGFLVRTKVKDHVSVYDEYLPVGEYKATFEDGRSIPIKITSRGGGSNGDGTNVDIDGRKE